MGKARKHCYEYPRPALTVDIVVLTAGPAPRVLLIRRKADPFAGRWALPGGFVDENEPLDAAARRELREETGIEADKLEQVLACGDPGRDPRGWTVTVVHQTVVKADAVKPQAADDAAEVGWHPLDNLPEMAFDHGKILEHVRQSRRTRKGKGKGIVSQLGGVFPKPRRGGSQ
jgi:8-oxo-dGTP diphosphatase